MERESKEVACRWAGLVVTERAGGVRVAVRVRPKSSRSAILGVREGALDIALTSPPVEGAANAELVLLLSKGLDVQRGSIAIVAGASSRNKVVEVGGITGAEVRARLSAGAP